MTKNRDLAYGDRLPEMWVDAFQEVTSTLLVNLRVVILPPSTLRIPAGAGNDQVGAMIQGRWRYVVANVDAAHPGGAAGTYDLYLTASDNVFTPSGLPPGDPPEIDNTVYAFAMQIRTAGSPPAAALYRKIADVTWDGAKITRVSMIAGNAAIAIGDVVVVAPETGTRNTIRPTGDFPAMRLQRRLDSDGGDLWQLLNEAGVVIARWTHDGVCMPGSLTSTERDALPAGRRPVGGMFYNPTTGRHETNIGTDAVPIWTGVGGYGPGIGLDFMGPETQKPPRTEMMDGRYLDKLTEPGLWLKLSDGGGGINPWDTFGGLPAPPAGKYRVPDLRGRGTVGKKDMGLGNVSTPSLLGASIARTQAATLAALIGEEFHTLLTAEIPNISGNTGSESVQHTHSGTTGADTPPHGHVVNDPTHRHAQDPQTAYKDVAAGTSGSMWTGDVRTGFTGFASTGISVGAPLVTHAHPFTSGFESATHVHTFSLGTGGGAHENVFPVAVCNKVITL